MKRFNKEILPFGQYCRQWRMRCGIPATMMAEIANIKNANDIYQFEGGHRNNLYLLSEYIKAGCNITFEMTLSAETKGITKNEML